MEKNGDTDWVEQTEKQPHQVTEGPPVLLRYDSKLKAGLSFERMSSNQICVTFCAAAPISVKNMTKINRVFDFQMIYIQYSNFAWLDPPGVQLLFILYCLAVMDGVTH